ncbi:hypothetical protein C799_01614 [Bacteroides thetaiotaomicron dnLKV9]|uniref:Alpha-1,2-fucosyltransferase n=1 Tax=Bacteroides thetaiotaomicron dnLKV9 TaxID=1235785 RepID=R9HBR9_BACT4|nr:alpha-1,2-fucosyltransferase [Bacteroides thetaiotaomicron]EOS01236.1 hypothetical protein C799_01614 [Bacteroides thetaiotaomicron dnLKV9]
MKIINILGGLGNQMFEYAMYLALKNAHSEEEILCSTRSFCGYGLHNGYELGRIFGIQVKEASLLQLTKLAYPFFNYKSWQVMRHWLPVRKTMTRGAINIPFDYSQVMREDSVYYDGYWQNEKNFLHIREEILTAYTFPKFDDEKNQELADIIVKSNAVSCHIRRGDYLKEINMCVCTSSYYAHAISYMNEEINPNLYCVFSDDIEWCRNNICELMGEDKKIIFIDWNKGEKSFRDMQLMSLCKHNIIANSSFSWWGAWLNRNDKKIVVAPTRWIASEVKNDPLCDSWKRIE